MAEVLGTTVGVIALGIQVCQGLYSHCSAVKGRSQDIQDISRQIQSLESTFRALAAVLPRAESLSYAKAAALASVRECITNCEEGVRQLEGFLASLGGPPGDGVKEKMKGAGRKLAYGFRRDEVPGLQRKVQLLTTTADLALQILTLYAYPP